MKVRKTKQQIDDHAALEKIMAAVERGILNDWVAKAKEKPVVALRLSKHRGGPKLEVAHKDDATGQALLMSALGSIDPSFVDGITEQLLYLNRYE